MKILKNIKKTIVIAEACENHFGKISNAIKMIDFAKKSGADYIKFQHHIPDEEMLKKVPRSKNFSISLYNSLKKYSFKIEDHKILMNYCKKKNKINDELFLLNNMFTKIIDNMQLEIDKKKLSSEVHVVFRVNN